MDLPAHLAAPEAEALAVVCGSVVHRKWEGYC